MCWAADVGDAAETVGGDGEQPRHCWSPDSGGAGHYVPDQVLVKFKHTPGAARTAAVQARQPLLPSLRLSRLGGEHHATVLPHHVAASKGRTLSAAEASAAPDVPSEALMLYNIVDGSSVPDVVERLCQHPGAFFAGPHQRQHTHVHGSSMSGQPSLAAFRLHKPPAHLLQTVHTLVREPPPTHPPRLACPACHAWFYRRPVTRPACPTLPSLQTSMSWSPTS